MYAMESTEFVQLANRLITLYLNHVFHIGLFFALVICFINNFVFVLSYTFNSYMPKYSTLVALAFLKAIF